MTNTIVSNKLSCFGMWFFEFLSDNPEEVAVEEEKMDLLTVSVSYLQY